MAPYSTGQPEQHTEPTNRISQATSHPELGPESQTAAEAALILKSYFLVILRSWEYQEWHLGSHTHYFRSCKTVKVGPGLRQILSHTLLSWGDQGKDYQPPNKGDKLPFPFKIRLCSNLITRVEPGPSQIPACIFRTYKCLGSKEINI